MYSNVIRKTFFGISNAFFLHREHALSQYPDFFLKNAEFKFAFFRVYTWCNVMVSFYLTCFGIQNKC